MLGGKEMNVRKAGIDDVDFILQTFLEIDKLHRKLLGAETYAKYFKNYFDEKLWRIRLIHEMNDFTNAFLILTDNRKNVGAIQVKCDNSGNFIKYISVTEKGKGYGKILMLEAFTLIDKLFMEGKISTKKVGLKVLRSNTRAIEFYKALGFDFSKNNNDEHVYSMIKI